VLVKIYWIDKISLGKLGIMARPRGGDWLEDEIKSLRNSGVDIIVSLLESEEILELDIVDEERLCKLHDISFLSLPIKDRDVPLSIQETFKFAQTLSDFLKKEKNVVIHCRQGVGRSSLIAACVLVLNGFSSEAAFEKIKLARTCEVPDTKEQRDWVKKFALDI
jgi:protein-tyrosine phosphatase